ncbi:MAG TPA: ubiquinone/menaquinone biosynthesis methyltransferase [Anaerolineae bacterium]|nr:ubiquinone/menaquinone biosynthesis methyltransferase [Anaerolineae bacterium]HQH39568.1 ubiquinone/menaquinone biosynthesis methyltransferase [Anaerolineae bacterium]
MNHPYVPDADQKQSIRALFTHIAPTYDKINRLLSWGQDQNWRQQVLIQAQVPAGGRLLDVATGTGAVALLAAERLPDAQIVGVDLTPAMLAEARQKAGAHSTAAQRIQWVHNDGLTLAFPSNTFDAVVSVFMLRNVPDVARAFDEQVRVVRPGGRVVCLEMTWPQCFPMTWLFPLYFFGLAPLLGQLMAKDRAAYTYLPQSVRQFPAPAATAKVMEAAGLRDVSWKLKMLGTVAVFVGRK